MKKARIILVAAAVGGLLLAATTGWSVYDYVQHDPGFCTNCHIMDDAYARWAESAHSKITCHACHAPDLGANLRQLWLYWTAPPDKPRHAPELENSACYGCHRVPSDERDHDDSDSPRDHAWEDVLAEAGHRTHVAVQKIQCVRCHSTALHKFVPPKEICTQCHKHENLTLTKMDEHCTTCHNFTATDHEGLLPTRADCLGCHKEMQVEAEIFPEHNGMEKSVMHWDCGKCHKPHTQVRLAPSDCRGCHDKKIGDSDFHAQPEHATCTQCHKPHLWKVTQPDVCMGCHDKDEEHTEGESCLECHP